MKKKFLSMRRWGAAAIAGTLLVGGLSVLGAGVASAATTATAATTTGASATSIPGTSTGALGGSLTVTVTGAVTSGDKIIIIAACPTAGTVSFTGTINSGAVTTVTDSNSDVWNITNGSNSACGSTVNNELIFTAATTEATGPSFSFAPNYATSAATAGSEGLSGEYVPSAAAASTFTVPSDATIIWFTTTANTPAVVLGSSLTNQAVSNVTVSVPANLNLTPTNSYICLVFTKTGDSFGSTAPTAAAVGASVAAATEVTTTLTTTAFTSNASANNAVQFQITAAPGATAGATFTLSGITVNTGTAAGAATAYAFVDAAAGCAANTTNIGGATLFSQLSTTQTSGADGTADGTVAQEFEDAYPVSGNGNRTAVLATDADPYDALSAAYLEGELGTGLLIVPPNGPFAGSDAAAAIALEGVQTVYIVGGPLAISPTVVAAIAATPATTNGGLTTTGKNIAVVGGATSTTQTSGVLFGATQDVTAQAIDTYFGSAYGSVNVNGSYTAAGGLYNDTTGNASTSGPGSVPTAVVISDQDWSDAMAFAPEAFAFRLPVILTEQAPTGTSTLGTEATAALTSLGVKQVIVIGGQLALPNTVVTAIQAVNGGISVLRIAGITGSDTAAQIAKFALVATGTGLNWGAAGATQTTKFLVSHGDYWSDALGAAALGSGTTTASVRGTTPQPILLITNPTTVDSYTQAILNSAGSSTGIAGDTNIGTLNILGGPLAMPASTVSALVTDLST